MGNKHQHAEFDPVSICAKVRAGDRAAETQLIQRFSESVMFMLKRRTQDVALSEDLHQDTFRIIIERLRSEKGIAEPAKLSGFIHRTALNVCIDNARKVNRRKTYTGGDVYDYVPDPASSQLSKVIEEERIALVRSIIDDMKLTRDREVLRRFYVVEQDKAQICSHFALSAENFDRVISRARKRFSEAIRKRMRQLDVDEI